MWPRRPMALPLLVRQAERLRGPPPLGQPGWQEYVEQVGPSFLFHHLEPASDLGGQAGLAHAFELPVSLMNCQANFMAHLAAALPNHMALEVVDPGREHVLKFKHTVEDEFRKKGAKSGARARK